MPLRTEADLDRLLAQAGAQPVLIFKHSTACGVSAGAYRALQTALAGGHLSAAAVGMVRVVEDRPLSQSIARRFGVPHASPQALVVKGGRVVWHASHGALTVAALGSAVRAASAG